VSRLEEAGGQVLVDERDAVTTVLVCSAAFLSTQRDTVRRFVQAHNELTAWIRANSDQAQAMVRDELAALTRSKLSSDLVARAWGRIELTTEISRDALDRFVANAKAAGFLRAVPDLSRLVAAP
jgi:NitT/TauT family transport system substrate-binding protein